MPASKPRTQNIRPRPAGCHVSPRITRRPSNFLAGVCPTGPVATAAQMSQPMPKAGAIPTIVGRWRRHHPTIPQRYEMSPDANGVVCSMAEALTGDPEGPFTPASAGGSRLFLDKAPVTMHSVRQFGMAAISGGRPGGNDGEQGQGRQTHQEGGRQESQAKTRRQESKEGLRQAEHDHLTVNIARERTS